MSKLVVLHHPRKRFDAFPQSPSNLIRSGYADSGMILRWSLRPRLVAVKDGHL